MLFRFLHFFIFLFLFSSMVDLTFDAGTYHITLRYYDSKLGKFTQPDTINPAPGNPLALNRLAYTFNNPIRFTDPSGHVPENKNQREISTNAYVLEFAASNGRYTHLIHSSLNALVGEAGEISLSEPISLPIPPEYYPLLQEIIGFQRPSDLTARRIDMQHNTLSHPNSAQNKMFQAMERAFTREFVYIQPTRALSDSDFSRKKIPNNIPRFLFKDESTIHGQTKTAPTHFYYVHIPNSSFLESKHTVGVDGAGIKDDMHTGLGHEIGHVFNQQILMDQQVYPYLDQIDFSDRLDYAEQVLNQDNHPDSPGSELQWRQLGIPDLSLNFENDVVRPALNETFGYERYKRREYYFRETYGQSPRGFRSNLDR